MDSFANTDNIGKPPWDYDFLVNLEESRYPEYLSVLFQERTGSALNLKKPETFNQKMQWLKLFGASPLKCRLTDKISANDYVQERIGAEYIKPVLKVCSSFDDIDFSPLPSSFMIKCSHCGDWFIVIKDKEKFLNDKALFSITRARISGWLKKKYRWLSEFDLHYRYINPKIIIEPLMRDSIDKKAAEIKVYCFGSKPVFAVQRQAGSASGETYFDESRNAMDDVLFADEQSIFSRAYEHLKSAYDLSEKLAKDINFVRVDWLICNNRLYFSDFEFVPYSGFRPFKNRGTDFKLGSLIKLNE